MNINEIITNEIQKVINEKRVVTFSNNVYPNFGWCVILSGGGGSGKGYALNHSVPIDGKVINVDDFKKLYVKMHGNNINGEKYNSLNPDHVNYIHRQVRNARFKGKYINNIMNDKTHDIERLPNIILDMTGRNPKEDIVDIARQAKRIGYKVSLVWVIANRHEAILRNLMRDRRVPDNVLHKIHNELASKMPSFITDYRTPTIINEIWLLFNSTEGIEFSDLSGKEAKNCAVKLIKSNNGFNIPDSVWQRLKRYLGKNESNYDDLKTYMSSDEIINKYGTPKYDDNGNINGYTFDRTQFKNKNFYK